MEMLALLFVAAPSFTGHMHSSSAAIAAASRCAECMHCLSQAMLLTAPSEYVHEHQASALRTSIAKQAGIMARHCWGVLHMTADHIVSLCDLCC